MLALERLSPLERAASLLHDVFVASFDEIAEMRNCWLLIEIWRHG